MPELFERWHDYYLVLGGAAGDAGRVAVCRSLGRRRLSDQRATADARAFIARWWCISPPSFRLRRWRWRHASRAFVRRCSSVAARWWASSSRSTPPSRVARLTTDRTDHLCYGLMPGSISYIVILPPGDDLGRRQSVPRGARRRPAGAPRRQYPQCLGPHRRWCAGTATTRTSASLDHAHLTLVPVFTLANVFTLPMALAKTLQGLASRVSPPCEIGVRPKPMAMAGPCGQ